MDKRAQHDRDPGQQPRPHLIDLGFRSNSSGQYQQVQAKKALHGSALTKSGIPSRTGKVSQAKDFADSTGSEKRKEKMEQGSYNHPQQALKFARPDPDKKYETGIETTKFFLGLRKSTIPEHDLPPGPEDTAMAAKQVRKPSPHRSSATGADAASLSSSSTRTTTEPSSDIKKEAKAVASEQPRLPMHRPSHSTELNKEPKMPRRSIRGGAETTAPNEHGGGERGRSKAKRPGDLEPMPGVQAPRECLTRRR